MEFVERDKSPRPGRPDPGLGLRSDSFTPRGLSVDWDLKPLRPASPQREGKTMTAEVQATFWSASLAVQVKELRPTANCDPEAGMHVVAIG